MSQDQDLFGGLNVYERKQEERRERLLDRADKARTQSSQAYERSNDAVSGIPMGQPILVGHHSERRHRRALERSHNAMDESVALSKKADELERRANSVGKGGVSSDDPDAIDKLQAKLDKITEWHGVMKKVNACFRKAGIDGIRAEFGDKVAATVESNLKACPWIKRPFTWEITNNNANIRRIEKRIEELKAQGEREDVNEEHEGFQFEVNTDENRVRFFFDGIPSQEVRTLLKRNGFKWARSVGAWQRQATQNGMATADYIKPQVVELMKAA